MLVAISLLAFIINISAPGDPVEKLSNSADKEGAANEQSNATKKVKQELRKKLGLDLTLRPSEISEEKYYQITEVYEKKFYNDN